jgi:hypothetical protein
MVMEEALNARSEGINKLGVHRHNHMHYAISCRYYSIPYLETYHYNSITV